VLLVFFAVWELDRFGLSALPLCGAALHFFFQTAKKKRSKENAFTPQPLNYPQRTASLVARICYALQLSAAVEKNLLSF
jgi:hypothetical protein